MLQHLDSPANVFSYDPLLRTEEFAVSDNGSDVNSAVSGRSMHLLRHQRQHSTAMWVLIQIAAEGFVRLNSLYSNWINLISYHVSK